MRQLDIFFVVWAGAILTLAAVSPSDAEVENDVAGEAPIMVAASRALFHADRADTDNDRDAPPRTKIRRDFRQFSDRRIVQRRAVSINRQSIPRHATKRPTRLQVPLFDGSTVDVVLKRLVVRGRESFSWLGVVAGEDGSRVILTVNGETVVANIRSVVHGTHQLRIAADGKQELHKIDDTAYPDCGCDDDAEEVAPDEPEDGPAGVGSGGGGAEASTAGDTQVDLMVVYTPAAKIASGGKVAVEALINLAIDEANQAYDDSQVAIHLRLVHMQEVGYTETGDSATDLSRLRANGDGYADEVHPLRDKYGADAVSMFFDQPTTCGRAYRMTSLSGMSESAFSVVHWSCAVGNYSLIHELGHNFGCRHAIGDSGLTRSSAALTSYSYGWHFTGSDLVEYRTIMAKQSGTRIGYFSNPDVTFLGTPTGVAIGQSDEAHNAASINDARDYVATWRPTTVALEVSPIQEVFSEGWVGGPFTPTEHVYALTNSGAATLGWQAFADEGWLTLSPASGTIAAGGIASVTATLNSAASVLPRALHGAAITFSNLISTVAHERDFELSVQGAAMLPFSEGFETARLDSFWSTGGSGENRIRVTSEETAHGGAFHALLDDENSGGLFSRNEMTLAVDLRGYSNVVLSFFAREWGDEAHGPPAVPFTGSADFDGVAISDDGVAWYEVTDLRTLTETYTEKVVDLDAAIATHGLSYTADFRIRFNQYDNYAIDNDGIGLDDVSITGTSLVARTDVAVVAAVQNPSPAVGETNVYSVTVSNVGPSSASGVLVQDICPAGVSYITYTVTQGSFDHETGLWSIGGLAVGAVATLDMTVSIHAGLDGTSLTNQALVEALDQIDSNVINDEDSAVMAVELTIGVVAGPNGAVNPAAVSVAIGGSESFAIQADVYYHIETVSTNGGAVPGAQGLASTNFDWNNIMSTGALAAIFAANVATNDTPEWWLAAHGLSGDPNEQALADVDGDGHPAWAEYKAGTDPTDSVSVLLIEGVDLSSPVGPILTWSSAEDRSYTLQFSTNLLAGYVDLDTGVIAVPPLNTYTALVEDAVRFFRIGVE